MFEELGMPILHIGACEDCSIDYFWETVPTTSYFASCSEEQRNASKFEECNEEPLYPVDIWLYDHRTRGLINNEDFPLSFPDKAIQKGQFVEWPIGGRKITPAHAVEILNSVGPSLSGSERLHAETACVADVDVTSDEHRQSGKGIKGAGAGGYACFDNTVVTKYLKGCSAGGEDEPEAPPAVVSGACYDMGSHTCGCGPNECNAELCAASSGIWSDRCPDHCKECGAEVTEQDVTQQDVTEQAKEEEHSGSHDEGNHDSHDEEHDHDSHDHSDHTDKDMDDSSANGHFVFGALATAASLALLSW